MAEQVPLIQVPQLPVGGNDPHPQQQPPNQPGQPIPPPNVPVAGLPIVPQQIGAQPDGPPPPALRNYTALYQHHDLDRYQNDYGEIMIDYAAMTAGQSRYGPAILFNRLTAASGHNVPTAMIQLNRDVANPQDHGVIQVYHRVTRYPTTIVGEASPWDGKVYAIRGDLIRQQYAIVPFNDENTNLAPNGTSVLDNATMIAEIANNPDAPTPPVDQNTDGAVQIRTRNSMHVPFRYVPLLLGRPLPPKVAFTRVYNAATTANQVDVVQPLLDFLKLSCTLSGPAVPSAVGQAWPTLPTPADEALVSFFDELVHKDLPLLHPNQDATGNMVPIVRAVESLTNEQRNTRLEAAARHQSTSAPVTIESAFHNHGVQKLMRLANVHDPNHLPAFWSQLAACKKITRATYIQSSVNATKEQLQVHTDIPVTVSLATKLMTVVFAPADEDDVTQGINPFLFGLISPPEREAIRLNQAMHQIIQDGSGTPAISDTRILQAPDAARVATNSQSLACSIDGFRVLLTLTLGFMHPIPVWLEKQRKALDQYASQLHVEAQQSPAIWTHIQRYIQKSVAQWFKKQENSATIVPADDTDVVQQAAGGRDWWKFRLPSNITVYEPMLPSVISTALSSLTPAVTARVPTVQTRAPATAASTTNGDSTLNPQPNDMFAEIAARPGIRSKNVRERCAAQGIELPKDTAGNTRCIAWHFKHRCNTGCRYSNDHHNNHTAADNQVLKTWGLEHFKSE